MNRLQYESSPYLQQHKNNPIDWYPWGEEALRKAVEEDKIIILSVGYSTCHWCHVMERETFVDLQVAEIMNRDFVCIKLDREERPDIDAIYMDALQNMGKSGGWPMNMFLIPTGEPFFGGTYFPKAQWIETINGVARVYKNQKEEVVKAAKGFSESLNIKDSDRFIFGDHAEEEVGFTDQELQHIAETLIKDFDVHHGGMNRSPKFPLPSLWKMIFNLERATGNQKLKDQLQLTLKRMVLGGIFDHLGGGWMRYATDARWKIPHFEKMLYDNGLLMELYAVCSRLDTDLYQWAVNQTFNWLNTEMNAPDSGFYAALDADSEGEEGKFYVWRKDETDDLLGEKAASFNYAYQIKDSGNWEDQKNILHLELLPQNWEEIKKSGDKLLEYRNKRVYPGLDNKIIVSWNAFAISGLIARSKAFDLPYTLAKEKLDFLNESLSFESGKNGIGIYHQLGNQSILGFLDDYAALILANINFYTISFDEQYLFMAQKLTTYVLENFYDEEEELFYYTDKGSEKLIARKKEIFDNVIPSSNSMMAKALYFVGRYLEMPAMTDLSKRMFTKIKPMIMADPQWLSNWLDLGLMLAAKQKEVVITGSQAKEWTDKLRKNFDFPSILYFAAENDSQLNVFEERFTDKNTIYICENYACRLPVYDIQTAIDILNEN